MAQRAGPQSVVGHLRLYLRILQGVLGQDEETATLETGEASTAALSLYVRSHQICADAIFLKIRGVR